MKYKVAVVVGIRPDFIRTSKVIKLLNNHPRIELSLIHTGQHYDYNLNKVFFDQLGIPEIKYKLDTRGRNHNEQHAKLIQQLSDTLEKDRQDVCLFLGDANAVIGSIAPLKLGVPIAHIEAGMRSYDWKMPEERNRVIIDRISDALYVYHDDYRVQLIQEGIPAHKILVTGNIIVDVLNEYESKFIWPKHNRIVVTQSNSNITSLEIYPKRYAVMTLHRDEHMNCPTTAQCIIDSVGVASKRYGLPVILIEMPRLKNLGLRYPSNFIPIQPLDFFTYVTLEKHAAIEFTDSGTNQEVASHYRTPCVVTRDSTERPECGLSGTTVLTASHDIPDAAEYVMGAEPNESFSLGDGKASEKITADLVARLDRGFGREWPPIRDIFKLEHFKRYHKMAQGGFVYG